MLERWYYTHDGQRFGPVSTEDLDRLTTEHRLLPTDLLWRMGADASTAVEAGTVLIALAQTPGYIPKHAATGPTAQPTSARPGATTTAPAASTGTATPPARSAPLPEWLSDVQACEAGGHPNAGRPPSNAASLNWVPPTVDSGAGQAAVPCPDWLHELQTAAAPANQSLSKKLSEAQTGPTGTIMQAPAIVRPPQSAPPPTPEPQTASSSKTEPPPNERSPAKPGSREAVLERAQEDLEGWVNSPANRALIIKGDIRVILGEQTVQVLLARYRMHGPAVQEKLRKQLRTLIERARNRPPENASEHPSA